MSQKNNGSDPMADVIVVAPSEELRRRASLPGFTGLDTDAIARAEQALVELSSSFNSWIEEEAEALATARDAAVKAGFSRESLSALFHCAHDIKGQASTLGYPVVGQMAASLCHLIDHVPDPTKIPEVLVNQHVDAIRAMIREDAKDAGNETAQKLLRRLSEVTEEVIEAAAAASGKDG